MLFVTRHLAGASELLSSLETGSVEVVYAVYIAFIRRPRGKFYQDVPRLLLYQEANTGKLGWRSCLQLV